MVRYSTIVAIVILLAIGLNYLNEDIPEDLPGWFPTKIWLGSFKALDALVRFELLKFLNFCTSATQGHIGIITCTIGN